MKPMQKRQSPETQKDRVLMLLFELTGPAVPEPLLDPCRTPTPYIQSTGRSTSAASDMYPHCSPFLQACRYPLVPGSDHCRGLRTGLCLHSCPYALISTEKNQEILLNLTSDNTTALLKPSKISPLNSQILASTLRSCMTSLLPLTAPLSTQPAPSSLVSNSHCRALPLAVPSFWNAPPSDSCIVCSLLPPGFFNCYLSNEATPGIPPSNGTSLSPCIPFIALRHLYGYYYLYLPSVCTSYEKLGCLLL